LPRRVVVTGVGLLCSVGSGTEESWKALRDGVSGIDTIKSFDPTGFACRIAGEVRNFDPAVWVEKKEIKKMGRFIQFGIAAGEYAMCGSGLKITPEIAERVGVYIGSGIGGFEVINASTRIFSRKGRDAFRRSLFRRRLLTWRPAMWRFEPEPRGQIPPPRLRAPAALIRSAILTN